MQHDFDQIYKTSLKFSYAKTAAMDYFAFVKSISMLADKFKIEGAPAEKFAQMLAILDNVV